VQDGSQSGRVLQGKDQDTAGEWRNETSGWADVCGSNKQYFSNDYQLLNVLQEMIESKAKLPDLPVPGAEKK
jgi:hypothetical protein